MNHSQVFKNGPRTPVINCIGEAVLGDIERLVAARTAIYSFQDAIETCGVDFTEEIFFARIIQNRTATCEAAAKEFSRDGGIEAYHLTGVVVDTVIVACARCSCDRSQQHVEGQRETPRLGGMQRTPVEEGILQSVNTTIKRTQWDACIAEMLVP